MMKLDNHEIVLLQESIWVRLLQDKALSEEGRKELQALRRKLLNYLDEVGYTHDLWE